MFGRVRTGSCLHASGASGMGGGGGGGVPW